MVAEMRDYPERFKHLSKRKKDKDYGRRFMIRIIGECAEKSTSVSKKMEAVRMLMAIRREGVTLTALKKLARGDKAMQQKIYRLQKVLEAEIERQGNEGNPGSVTGSYDPLLSGGGN